MGKLTKIVDHEYEVNGKDIEVSPDPCDKAVFHYELVFSGDLNAAKKSAPIEMAQGWLIK